MSLVVLGGGVSPFVRKVRVALAEKGLDYTHEQVNPFAPPAGYREISPLGKIPAFKDGDRTLCDSSVICAYLEKTHPKPALYPSDPYDYARALSGSRSSWMAASSRSWGRTSSSRWCSSR